MGCFSCNVSWGPEWNRPPGAHLEKAEIGLWHLLGRYGEIIGTKLVEILTHDIHEILLLLHVIAICIYM